MRLGLFVLNTFKSQCRLRLFNRNFHAYSRNLTQYQCFLFCHNLKNDNYFSSIVQEVFRLPYSTNTKNVSKNSEVSEKAEPSQSKKKKEFKVYITLLGPDGNIISVTTVEDATKLATRRNMRLVNVLDLDPKTGRAVYKLMTESDYVKADSDWQKSTPKKDKERFIKGDKVVSLSSSTAEHDVLIKTKMILKWLLKRFEVRIIITGDTKNGESVFKIIEKEVGTNGRIVQKRFKGQDIRFQIIPPKTPKKTEGSETAKEEILDEKINPA